MQTLGGRSGSGLSGGLFGNGVVDTTSQLPNSQTLQPQNSTMNTKLQPSRLEQIMSARANVKLNQFGYDLDRLQFVAQDEAELLERVRKDYEAFIAAVTEAIELIRAGKGAQGPCFGTIEDVIICPCQG